MADRKRVDPSDVLGWPGLSQLYVRLQVVAVPANVTVNQDLYRISAHTSDLIELISGVCKVRSHITSQQCLLF